MYLWVHSGRQTLPLRLIAAICRSRREDDFATCNLPLPTGGRFRSLQFAAPDGRTVSQPAICRFQREDGFAACNLLLPMGGRFRSLHFRKVSIIGGFANISAEKIGFGKRIFCFAVGLSGKNKSAGAGSRAAADSVSEFEDNIAGLVVDCEKNLIQSLSY